ncbi:MAG: hypothetical protein CVU46_14480 [Chloroflexi bacterium HGW-Chloroflexi-8]|jgi:hypothetical protein|nr:MAG: hypothetical protein CVU46_14480 [Chloroflexi bacterium HGW-Chloroflexi-8]
MKNNTHVFSNPGFGTAISIHCIESKTKIGIGNKSKNGFIDFYIPLGTSEKDTKRTIIEEFVKLTKLDASKFELISGAKQTYIITMIGLSADSFREMVEK